MRHVLANICVFGLIAGFSVLSALNPDVYYQHVQEDQPLEWATFWGFVVAGVLFVCAAILERRKRPLPWFFVGLAAFCVVVAMEEISWGQRVLGYSPPRYFLENNYQLELNLHNVMATSLRKLMVGAVLIVYGMLLPLLHHVPTTDRLLTKLGITAPPLALTPIFAALLVLLVSYPLRYTGEIVEVGMGLAFLFAAVSAVDEIVVDQTEPTRWFMFGGTLALVAMLGFASALCSRGQLAADPVVAEVTAAEIRALKGDIRAMFEDGTRVCGKHERLTLISKLFPSERLTEGRFMELTQQGLPMERAEFFVDPWSTAYWMRATCNKKRDKIFLYSFGPNRRRDSSRWKRRGDDIGVIFRLRHDEQPARAMAQSE